ncbi:ubiquitin carboxyl-terminal hydrolase 7 isoform X1 [Eurytemora carolleeae]|uniref:ubiquitin carboxyl-terminal hydrolase 7 isoform X1 n=1 Tax=Eurytemora carolleeae TaxID=1294199 RepID=UPI000C7591AF|nr:ubiquitin carboxyl-terminal hydrolase 7 isoform X1 [Eurytemora carolleeae]|eukprot:XP_023345461.1 ubiquitin carboxyl-terminal hydrolase 7-like isoform X1 [Eurytemora affinis]
MDDLMETTEPDSTTINNGVVDEPEPIEEDVDPKPEAEEGPEDDDEARSEATFSFKVENFSQLSDSALSPHCIIRNLPWKIMIMQRQNQNQERSGKSLGYFLQCNGESESGAWSCNANAELRMINQKDGTKFKRNIFHLFYSKENDWGFSHYMSWNDVLDPEKGFIKDDTVIFEVKVNADAPHGVSWDSKKHTGYVGLKNQGATCYMNSLLQVLYFTNLLRKAVYKMPTESDDSQKSVGLALQRVFHELQFLDKPVGTKKLTKSFGWETLDSFMQHDVQEFLRVLLDKLEIKMKTTCVEGTIPRLFEGKMMSYIKCKNVDYKSTMSESFYDIQLNIKGKKSILESFHDYIQTETLDGDNKYDAGTFGLQDAEKGIIFEKFPPILHLHLMRFQYDPITDSSVKFNDRCEFSEVLDLSKFLQDPSGDTEEYKYRLHAVLVHSGDNHGGHYVVFINPLGDGSWCKFDDDVVSKCTKKEAIEQNFGGDSEDTTAVRHCTNAYMLVYIQQTRLDEILGKVGEEDIPEALSSRLQEEKKLEAIRRKEKNEAYLYMTVKIVLEDSFYGHQGNDLFDPETVPSIEYRVKKASTCKEFMNMLAEEFRCRVDRIRPWPLTIRNNQTMRPTLAEMDDGERSMTEVSDNLQPWFVFLEMCPADLPSISLPIFDKDQDVVLFFKYYCPRTKKVLYMGHQYLPITTKLSSILPKLCQKANLPPPPQSKLILWEEIKPNMLEKIEDVDQPLEHILEEVQLMDGDIIVYQLDPPADADYELPTARDYFRDLFYKVEVNFCDKNLPNDPGFNLQLSQRINYDQLAKKVADQLETEPDLLQFFKSQSYRDGPGQALRCNFEGTLKDIIQYFRPKQVKRVYYQRLQISISELENKKQFKCLWISSNLKEEKELVLYPNRNSNVGDLFVEALRSGQLDLPETGGTKKLRLLEIISNKIFTICGEEISLDVLLSAQGGATKSFRLEEIPADELILGEGEILVPVAHFSKEVYTTFGSPFLIKVKTGDTVESIRRRIQERISVSDKEWEKYRLAVVLNMKPLYFEENENKHLDIKDFRGVPQYGSSSAGRPWIGLEHANKANKRSRYSYTEKAIKIYN